MGKTKTGSRQTFHPLRIAWSGWSALAPADWRPIKIEGEDYKGAIILGDAEHAICQVKWWRPSEESFDVDRWMRRRIKAHSKVNPEIVELKSPKLNLVLYAEDVEFHEGMTRGLWYGYREGGRVLLEVTISGDLPKSVRKLVNHLFLPSIEIARKTDQRKFCLHEASFEVPAEFDLIAKQLKLGDVTLVFGANGGRKIQLRQVYPGELALKRRPLEVWIEKEVFSKTRRTLTLRDFEEWEENSVLDINCSVMRRRFQTLPIPLNFLKRRFQVQGGGMDKELNRLLFVEVEAPSEDGLESFALDLIGGMNREVKARKAEVSE